MMRTAEALDDIPDMYDVLPKKSSEINGSLHSVKFTHVASRVYLSSEANRLSTFERWPLCQPSPKALAAAGFYYKLIGQDTACPFCELKIEKWSPEDVPITKHAKCSPSCPFILSLSGSCSETRTLSSMFRLPEFIQTGPTTFVPSAVIHLLNGESADTLLIDILNLEPKTLPQMLPRISKPNINTTQQFSLNALAQLPSDVNTSLPREFNSLDARIQTFSNWPIQLAQRPDQLAEAGFFYTGSGDQVKCFACDGVLCNWEPKDDPWEGHARWFPRCDFLLRVKGSEFIKKVSARNQQSSTGDADCSGTSVAYDEVDGCLLDISK